MGFVEPTLPFVKGALSLPLSFLLPLLEWAYLSPAEMLFLASSAILRVVALFVSAPVV